jgi:DNA-binding MarR family transcriptional regulator
MADLKRLYHDLVRFETELWAAVDTRLRTECDLQLTWFEIMQLLGREPRRRVQDVATEFAISVGGASKVVDRIVAAGYCCRIPNPQDGRSALLELTETGQRKLADVVPVFEDELALRFRSVLGEGELERLALSLRLLRASAFAVDEPLSA